MPVPVGSRPASPAAGPHATGNTVPRGHSECSVTPRAPAGSHRSPPAAGFPAPRRGECPQKRAQRNLYPSRLPAGVHGRPAADRNDPAAPPRCAGGAAAPLAEPADILAPGTPPSSRPVPDRSTGKSRTARDKSRTAAGEIRPHPGSLPTAALDIAAKTWNLMLNGDRFRALCARSRGSGVAAPDPFFSPNGRDSPLPRKPDYATTLGHSLRKPRFHVSGDKTPSMRIWRTSCTDPSRCCSRSSMR